MRITNIIAVILAIIGLAAFCCFFYYPYGELDSIQEKTNIAMTCLYTIIASALGLVVNTVVAAIADRD